MNEECREIMQKHPGIFSRNAVISTLEDLLFYIHPDSGAGKVIVEKLEKLKREP